MTDDLLHDLGAVGRLDVELQAAATGESTPSLDDRWTVATRDRKQRERLMASFLADELEMPPPAARRRPGRIAVLSTVFAAAASLLVAWRLADGPEAPQADPLGYTLSVAGGVVAQRGAPTVSSAVFHAGDPIRLRLTPQTPMHPSIDLQVRATHGDQHIDLAWPWRMDPAEGVIEINGHTDELLRAAAGTWTLSVELRDAAPPHMLRDRLSATVEIVP